MENKRETFFDRLKFEYSELLEKTEKLEAALIGEKVPESEVDILFAQLAIMKSYATVLQFRIEKAK